MALTQRVSEDSCWEFPGSYGHLGIVLKERISVHHISIDHIPRELASDVGILQAPRKMILWGQAQGANNVALAHQYLQHLEDQARKDPVPMAPRGLQNSSVLYVPLAQFEYKLLGSSKSHVQTASVPRYLKDLNMDFGVVILEILSNHGGSSTCLHRVRIHGSPVKALSIYTPTIAS